MLINSKIKFTLFIPGLLLFSSLANSAELQTSVTTIDADKANNISIGSETFITPFCQNLPGLIITKIV